MKKNSKKSNLYYFKKLAINNLNEKGKDKESLLRFLKKWWCLHYNRPYKDPLLMEYTFEELLLEYYEILYFSNEEEKQKVLIEINIFENGEEDEEWLKKEMGENYMSEDEMKNLLLEEVDNAKS